MKKFLEKIKNNKGFLSIEIVIGTVIFIMTMCVFVDLSTMIWKHNMVSQTNSHIARIVSLQGGVNYSAPEDFPGKGESYTNSYELYQDVENSMKSAGIKNSSDWNVTINGVTLKPGTSVQVPLNESITVVLKAKCKWGLVAQLFPGQPTKEIVSKRAVVSSYAPRTGQMQYFKK